MRIALYNEKGGSGKTTLAVSLAVSLKLPLFDLDPQATATRWLERRTEPYPLARRGDDDYVVDCPPTQNISTAAILKHCDIVLIPVKASFPDLITLPDTVRFVQCNTSAKIAFVASQIDSRTSDYELLIDALKPHGLPLLGMYTHRASYRRAGLNGGLASDTDVKANEEMKTILKALKKL
jgi:chromosome partitioning protein